MKYYYFVSFACEISKNFSYGNINLDLDKKIRTEEDIQKLQRHIELKGKVSKVTILNIVLLDSE